MRQEPRGLLCEIAAQVGDASYQLLWVGEREAHGVCIVTEVGAIVMWF